MSIQKAFVSNQMLHIYDGSETNAEFIVGSDYYFGQSQAAYEATNITNWTNSMAKAHRAAAGNAVYMWGNYFGPGEVPTDGSQRVLDRFNENSALEYFTVNMNLWDLKSDSTGYPRGSHSYSGWLSGSGHWKYIPKFDTRPATNNSAATDSDYSAEYAGDPPDVNRWYTNSDYYGTKEWHEKWLSGIKNGSPSHYDNLFGWYLMDEPFNSDELKRRDYESNQKSVSGHYDFCKTIEGTNERPKIVNGFRSTSSDFSSIQGVLSENNIGGIYMGNDYDTLSSTCWTTPNLVRWCKSQIGSTSSNMIMPWAPGWASEDMSRYFFYGSIVEGARGILWWMNSNETYTNYNYESYNHLTGLYSNFTSTRFSTKSDKWIILHGTNVTATNWDANPNFNRDPYAYSRYGKQLDKQYSAAVFKWYSNSKYYFRFFIVNHEHSNNPGSFDLHITDGNWDMDWLSAVTNGSIAGISNDPSYGCHITGDWNSNDYYSIIEVSDDTQ